MCLALVLVNHFPGTLTQFASLALCELDACTFVDRNFPSLFRVTRVSNLTNIDLQLETNEDFWQTWRDWRLLLSEAKQLSCKSDSMAIIIRMYFYLRFAG